MDEEFGGCIAQLDEETGEVYDRKSRHLVVSARFLVNFSVADRLAGTGEYESAATHVLSFLEKHQRDAERGDYHWLLGGPNPSTPDESATVTHSRFSRSRES